ncbi:MAG TPA: DUF503 domain-containing protein [Actinobacteria bacterium]|nr:DUF503 domain-containing protein [Actinomycetota bacterium]
MVLGLLELELHLPYCNSLKSKRKIVKSIIHKVRNRYNVSISEMDNNDLWQRTLIGISCVSKTENNVKNLFEKIEKEIFDTHLVNKIDKKISIFDSRI